MYVSGSLAILLVALVLDRLVGDPDAIWSRVPHPVVGFGKLVGVFDRTFNDEDVSGAARARRGFFSILLLVVFGAVVGRWLDMLLGLIGIAGIVVEILVVTVLLAQKSLVDHVRAVRDGLSEGGLDGGREAVSLIVGRDPETLDESAVARAAVESLAENASDGVVAPAFWYAVFGLPGLFAYKIINTADSMIGHRNEKYLAFGRSSAILDDIVNWIPARLTGLMIAIADGSLRGLRRARRTLVVMVRDARLHRSPNAGWPESAMAAATGVALGGPRYYGGELTDDPFLNVAGRHSVTEKDIETAIAVFWRAMTVLAVVVAVLAALI